MFTTLAETYMTATRMDAVFSHRIAESERIHLLQIRRAEEKAWIAEQSRVAAAEWRRAFVRGILRRAGLTLERAGAAVSRAGHAMAAEAGPARQCC